MVVFSVPTQGDSGATIGGRAKSSSHELSAIEHNIAPAIIYLAIVFIFLIL